MQRPLNDQVVVVTGASSGIGREGALQFGRAGSRVVLAARNEEALQTAVDEIERQGGEALAVPTDVAQWEQVRSLARRVIERFGRIDTWANVAVVTEYGLAVDQTVEEIDQIIQVGLMGQIHGMKAALEHMMAERRGAIINVASVEGERGMPLQAAYSAAKAGIKGFSEALRVELEKQKAGISVTLILPSSMNTPLFEHSRSKLGALPRPLAPVYEPRVAAESIVFAAEHPRKQIVVGGAGKMLAVLDRFAPELSDRVLLGPAKAFKKQKTKQPDDGTDNLFEASSGNGSVTGQFGNKSKSTSLYTRHLEHHPERKRMLLGAAAAGAVALLRKRDADDE